MHRKTFIYNKKQVIADLNSDADESVFNEIFLEKDYRPVEEIIKRAKNPVIDIGAHIGLFSIYVRTINPTVIIFAYEPEKANFQALKSNLKLNHVEANIIVKNLAVGAREGEKALYISPDSHNHSFVQKSEISQEVQVITLPKILEKTGTCDLVKMDCEGAEFEIIKSMAEDDFKKIRNIFIEYHEYSPDMKAAKLKQILERNGFKANLTQSRYDKKMGFIFAHM